MIRRPDEHLNGSLVGAYLQRSFAVGDFDRHSDVDFVVVVEDDLSAETIDTLQAWIGAGDMWNAAGFPEKFVLLLYNSVKQLA